MKSIEITEVNQGQRLDKFLQKLLPGMGKSLMYKMMRKKNIVLDRKKCTGMEKLIAGSIIDVYFSDETYEKFLVGDDLGDKRLPELLRQELKSMDIEVLYEDSALLVINKPVGVNAQPEKDCLSMNDLIDEHYRRTGFKMAEGMAVGIANRLDRNTTGIVFSGKKMDVFQALNEAIRDRSVHKYYRALVYGVLDEDLVLCGYLSKDHHTNQVKLMENGNGDYIETHITPLRTSKGVTEVEVQLLTGKTHQIRAHLSSIGHPIIGDGKYGDAHINGIYGKKYGARYQQLHAYRYDLSDCKQYELLAYTKVPFIAPLPEVFSKICEGEFHDRQES